MKAFVAAPRSAALRALNYEPAVERIRRAGSSSAMPLQDVVKALGPAYGSVFTRLDCSPSHGVELIAQSDMFSAEPSGRVIRRDSMPQPERHLVTRGQVLIAGAGTLGENELYGRAILADNRLAGKYVGPDSMSLHFEEPDNDFSLFAYAWLASRTGLQAIRSTSYGTKILRLRRDLLGSLPVPIAPTDIMARVAELVRRCVADRERFLEDLHAARRLVEALPAMEAAREMCGERRRHSLVWTSPLPSLSAWNVASTGGALRYLQGQWGSTLGDVIHSDGIYYGTRFARVACQPPHGIDFMSQRDAMLIRPAPRRIVHPGFAERQLYARPGTILVGAQGTLGEGEIFGRAVLVHDRFAKVAFTEHLLRIVPNDGRALSLYAYLTTTVGFRLLRTTAVGTKLLSLREDMLRTLPVPEWPDELATAVSDLVRSAFDARDRAEHAEEEAIRIVEEEVLPQWLG